MSNKFNDDLPSLAPDRDQVEAFKSKRTTSTATAGNQSPSKHSSTEPVKGSSGGGFQTFLLILMMAAMGGGGWWFYQVDVKNQALIIASEERIHDLEQQLSVTGEAMGESAGAMKVRIDKLSIKSEELWGQMDKLWASAWRRNQSDIASLAAKVAIQSSKMSRQEKASNTTTALVKSINQQQTETEFSIGVLTEQLQGTQNMQSQLSKLQSSLATLQSKSLSGDKQQIAMASNFTELNRQLKQLRKRLDTLEAQQTNTVN